jgi:ferredoxin
MRKLVVRRVWIERKACLAHTLCEPEAPSLIESDEASDAFRIKEECLRRTQQELQLLLEASRVCPMDAFYVETDCGEVLNVDDTDWVRAAIKLGNYAWETERA